MGLSWTREATGKENTDSNGEIIGALEEEYLRNKKIEREPWKNYQSLQIILQKQNDILQTSKLSR